MAIFERKIKTIPFNSFMDGSYKMTKEEKQTATSLALMPVATLLKADSVLAGGLVQDRIMAAFNPIIELIQGVSYPVAFLMLSGGMLLVMIGQKHRGLNMMKWAALGYIGMQFVPALMSIVVDVGKGMLGK